MSAPAQVSEAAPVQAEVPRMREEPRFLASVDLVALPTAVNMARVFIGTTLKHWHALFIEEYVAAVGVELVKLAVEATKPDESTKWRDITEINPIKLRLLGYKRHIVFEVTDRHTKPLVLPDNVYVPEDSGLGLVDALTSRWGSTIEPRGRVSWAELAVYERTEAGLPKREPEAPSWSGSPSSQLAEPVDEQLLRRVRDGLENV